MAKRAVSQTSRQRKERLRSFIAEQWQEFAKVADRYQWPLESARWGELVFCIIHHMGRPHVDADAGRDIVRILEMADMLHVETLARLVADDGKPDSDHPDFRFLARLLERRGCTPAQAASAVATICQAAHSVQRHFRGKIQQYLRLYGEQMLKELPAHFAFTHADSREIHHIYSHWLQNVLNMPVSIEEPVMANLAKEFGAESGDWAEIADELDINLAVIDDMVACARVSSVQTDTSAQSP